MKTETSNADSGFGPPPARPETWILVASVLTFSLFGLLTYHVNMTLQVGSQISQDYLRGEAFRDRIVGRGQSMSHAATMLVATGEEVWLTRYRELEEDLSTSLRNALKSRQAGYDEEALSETLEVASLLGDIRSQAFELAAAGQTSEALTALSDGRHDKMIARFEDASRRFIEAYRDYLQGQLLAHRRHELRSLGVGMAVFGICVLMWLYQARRERRRTLAFERELIEKTRLKEELLQSQKMEAVGRLASGIAHDFSNMITAIRGFATLAREQLPPEHPARRSVARVEEAADQAEGVTRGLLTFGRKNATEKKSVELTELVHGATLWFRRVLPGTIGLKIDVETPRKFWVFADPSQIQQVLLNLVVNARDAMQDGGEVTIRLTEMSAPDRGHADLVELSVTDTGTGMTADVMERVFEPFFTTKGSERGTGLGLSVVHGVVTDHGGRLTVDSVPGEGTVVRLALPLITEPAETEELPVEKSYLATSSGIVFLAQGHAYVRDILVTTLEDAGFSVSPATGCPEFRALYTDGELRPDLIVLDNDLPGGCGVNCLRKIRDFGYSGPAIVLAHEVTTQMERGLDNHAMLLRKPLRVGDLRRLAVAMTLNRPDVEEAA